MAVRRRQVQALLKEDELVLSMSIFPRLGVNPFTSSPETGPDPEHSFTRSIYWPTEATYQGHPRFRTLTTNLRQRRGRKVTMTDSIPTTEIIILITNSHPMLSRW